MYPKACAPIFMGPLSLLTGEINIVTAADLYRLSCLFSAVGEDVGGMLIVS